MMVQAVQSRTPNASSGAHGLPLLAIKLAVPPPLTTLIARQRLTARLDDARGRLVLVAAPAGAGKSSLVAQWCHGVAADRVAWLTLDSRDNDPVRFLQYLCAAVGRVTPELAQTIEDLSGYREPLPPDLVLTVLLNGIAAVQQPMMLVLDDYHLIEAPEVHQIVGSLLDSRPPLLSLVLMSRSEPPLPLARLRARGELVELRGRDLRFTLEEAEQFLKGGMGLALSQGAIRRLTERTEGWITGLQLAALSLQGRSDAEQFVESFSGSHRYIVDYLVEEVLARQSEDVRTFLRQTAILEQLCGPLCDAVTGQPGGRAMLERLHAASLFVIPQDEGRYWYRYHHLFAEVLRVRPEPLPPEEASALHERAGAWYEAEGMNTEAIGHALAGGKLEQVIRLIQRHGGSAALDRNPAAWEQWLRAVPAPQIRTRPLLALAVASICHYHRREDRVEEILGPSGFGLSDAPETRGLQGKRLLLLGMAARELGETDLAEERSREAVALLTRDGPYWRSMALRLLGEVSADRGKLEQALSRFAEALDEARQAGTPLPLLLATIESGAILESQGALRRAEQLYLDTLDFARQRYTLDLPLSGALFAALGRLRFEVNDLPGALPYMTEALERARTPSAGREAIHAFVAIYEMWRLQTALGNAGEADRLFERLAAATGCDRYYDRLVRALGTVRPETSAEEAAAWVREFEGRIEGEVSPGPSVPDSVSPDAASLEIRIWARLRAGRGGTEAVTQRLELFLHRMAANGREGSALPVRILLVTLLWEKRLHDRAVAALAPGLDLAAREGYARVFLDAGDAIAPVLRACAAHGTAPEYVGKLLATMGSRARQMAARASDREMTLIEPLSDRELEVLRLAAARLSNEEIASQLFLSTGTVKRHLHNINGKLDVTDRLAAVARAHALGLL